MNKKISSDFNKNVLKLMTGSTIAQAIPIAISPILTRMYTPEDYGIVTLFLTIATIFGAIANGRYEMAIVLPKKDEEAINIVALSLLIASAISFCLLIFIIFFRDFILHFLGNDDLKNWLFFIPFIVFFIGLYNALNQLNIRLRSFDIIAKVKVLKAVILAVTQLTLGFFKLGSIGLLIGHIFSHIFSNGQLANSTIKNKKLIRSINFNQIFTMAKRYKKFPLITTWATLSNVLTQQITNIFISYLYSHSTLGHYSLVNRTVGLPSNIIGQAIGDVYFQKASEDRKNLGNAKSAYMSTLMKLLIIGTPIFLFLFLIAEDLIAFVFGENWRIAGTYTKYLIPLFFIRFIASPLSLTNIVFEKQKIDFIWQISLLIITILLFFIAFLNNLTVETYFILYSSVLFVHYFILLLITYVVSKGNIVK